MFTRHLIAAAALMASACAAHADVISTATDSPVSALSSAAVDMASAGSFASNMSIVAGTAALSGASDGLATMLSAGQSAQLYLVRGVEGLYLLGSGASPAAAAPGDEVLAAGPGNLAPSADATALPEPSSIALMLAGVAGAVSVARRRKQQ